MNDQYDNRLITLKVGDFGRGDTSIQVTGLRPGQFYSIRVIASNAANFSTLGPLIRLRTLSSHPKLNGILLANDDNNIRHDGVNEAATIRVTPAHSEPAIAQPMIREHSGGHNQTKRASTGRRNSPVVLNTDSAQVNYAQIEDSTLEESSIDTLTERLDSLRVEQQELENQILEEEVDFKNSVADLSRERDQLKQILKEREEASSELRKQGNLISKQQKSAQSRKAQKERILNAKKAERQKTKEETMRWNQDIVDMRRDIQDMSLEQSEISSTKDRDIFNVRKVIVEDQAVIRSLEEEIRATGSQIKSLEKDRERMSDGGEEEIKLATQDKEEDQAWDSHVQSIQLHLSSLWQTLKQVGHLP